ncbi:MAG: glycosyltransferase family 39 protein, partial [Candidatus Promineifilaceae bacterium]
MKRQISNNERYRRFLALSVLILLLAAALRYHLIENQSFWNDEGNSARLSERSIPLIIEGTASDIHPPLYYLVLRGWRELVGESEFSLRLFSALSGVSLVAVVLTLSRQLLGAKSYSAALLAGFLAAINPALVYYSQEARMYELLALLASLSTALLIMWMQSGGKRILPAIGYVLTAAAGLYTHYFFPAVLLAQNLIMLLWLLVQWRTPGDETQVGNRRGFLFGAAGRWALIMIITFLLYLPWISTYLEQAGDRTPLRGLITTFFGDGMRWMVFGATLDENRSQYLVIGFVVLALLGAWFGRHKNVKNVPFTPTVLLSIMTPLILMWLLGATQPAFFKFMLVVIPPMCLLAGPGLLWGWRWAAGDLTGSDTFSDADDRGRDSSNLWLRMAARIILLISTAAVIVGSGRSLLNMYYVQGYARDDYRSMAEQIKSEGVPNAAVVLNAANQWEVFTYYHQDISNVYPLPRGYPDQTLIEKELKEIVEEHSRIYALFWGEAERDPERLVERWLDANAFKARDEWRGNVRFVTYAVPDEDTELVDINTRGISGSQFGEFIKLENARIEAEDIQPGEILEIELVWRTSEPLVERYKVFLHLVDKNGEIVAQRDSEPGGGLALTTTWQPDAAVVDNHGVLIPFGTPAGEYELRVGLYDAFDPASRLTIQTPDGDVDSLVL